MGDGNESGEIGQGSGLFLLMAGGPLQQSPARGPRAHSNLQEEAPSTVI